MFAFQTLGVMADAAEAIATDGDVSSCHVWKHVCTCMYGQRSHSVYLLYYAWADQKHRSFCIDRITIDSSV